nr:hypothetical protein [Saprospiraceae bacterium]
MAALYRFTGLLFAFFLLVSSLHAQTLTGVSTVWDDDYQEWSIFIEGDTVNLGQLELMSMLGSPRMDWSYRVLETFGKIRNLQRNDYSQWEVEGPFNIVTFRQQWRDDLREWRVTDNRITINWRSKYQNHYEEWEVSHRDFGYFAMYTLNPGDPRDWIIIDRLNEEVPFEMKMAFVFITVFLTSPH